MQTENVREENQIVQIEVTRLRTFKKHPFKVRDDEKMRELVDSIRERGIVTPVVVRPTEDGGYEALKEFHGKKDGRILTCGVISFTEEDKDLGKCWAAGKDMLREIYGNNYQVVYSMHTNTAHPHVHFLINTVGLDGRKLHMKKGYVQNVLQPVVNRYCRAYDLIENENFGRKQWDGKDIRILNREIAADMDAAIEKAESLPEFVQNMKLLGYRVTIGKSLTAQKEGMGKGRWTDRIGADYTLQRVVERIRDKRISPDLSALSDIPENRPRQSRTRVVIPPTRWKNMTEFQKENVRLLFQQGRNPFQEQRAGWIAQKHNMKLFQERRQAFVYVKYGVLKPDEIKMALAEIRKKQEDTAAKKRKITESLKDRRAMFKLVKRAEEQETRALTGRIDKSYQCLNLGTIIGGNGVTSVGASSFMCFLYENGEYKYKATVLDTTSEALLQYNWNGSYRGVFYKTSAPDTSWQNDYEWYIDARTSTMRLSRYIGTGTEVRVPARAVVDSVIYPVGINGNTYKGTGITSFSVVPGVMIASLYCMFQDCTSLTSVDLTGAGTLSAGITLTNAFAGCTALGEVNFTGIDISKQYSSSSGVFTGCNRLSRITVPSALSTSYSLILPGTFYEVQPDGSYGETGYTDLMKAPAGAVIGRTVSYFTVRLPVSVELTGENGFLSGDIPVTADTSIASGKSLVFQLYAGSQVPGYDLIWFSEISPRQLVWTGVSENSEQKIHMETEHLAPGEYRNGLVFQISVE